MDALERRAKVSATHWHFGQKRKYTDEPYIVHPARVAWIVKSVWHTPEMVAAAWLHDVLEDTDATGLEIEREFGELVFGYVVHLTDTYISPGYGNRAQRKAMERTRLSNVPAEVKTIKLADLIHNSESIMKYDEDFARTYIPEKRLLLDEALREGDPILWSRADAIVREAEEGRLAEWFKSKGAR